MTPKNNHKNTKKSIIERFLLQSPEWQDGYRAFNLLFAKPLGWAYVFDKMGEHSLFRLDRKGQCSFYASSASNQQDLEKFLHKYAAILAADPEQISQLPSFFKDLFGKQGAIFPMIYLGKLKGLLFLCSLTEPKNTLVHYLQPFRYFLHTHVELAYKNFELNNFYETVHPRALALSTMHSVHRVISSSIRLKDLLPRIGRLSAQVLKAQGCSIMLVDSEHEYLVPYFSFGGNRRLILNKRVKLGRGLQGKVAATGQFHLSRKSIAIPFIEDDVVGVIALWDKVDNLPFNQTDLEILKSLSEQAVTAIKNAQLFEETEKLTLGSIETINELLSLNVGDGDRGIVPLREIVLEVGKELQLSGRELTTLQRAIMLRDTGALASPQLWNKKGKLTKKELDTVKRIPLRGASLLSSISSLRPALPIITHHRERYDGKGYPSGLKGEDIPIGARIVAVVDSFAAMVSKRVYRERMTVVQAVTEIQAHSGTQFDPKVVDCFTRVVKDLNIEEKIRAARKNIKPKKGSPQNTGLV
jgi:hypothetical protein